MCSVNSVRQILVVVRGGFGVAQLGSFACKNSCSQVQASRERESGGGTMFAISEKLFFPDVAPVLRQ